MNELTKMFEESVTKSKSIPTRPSNDTLLKLYALFKQAQIGDVQGDKPGGFDFKGAAKYDAWASVKGMPKEDAMKKYIELVNSLL